MPQSKSETSQLLKAGDVVRVRDANEFLAAFGAKIKDRDAEVLWVGPKPDGSFRGKASIRFKKRNGRGQEFNEIMDVRHLIVQSVAA